MPENAAPTSCLELLRAMVRIDTVTPRTSGRPESEAPLGDYLAGLAELWGLGVQRLPVDGCAPNVLLTHQTDPAAPWWLFDSHLDTVGTEGMTVPPFEAEARDGRVYGRGACDTKASGAAMLWALRERVEAGAAGPNVALLLTIGEESCQVGADAFARNDAPRLPWRPAAVVVGEPTLMRVVRATNGYVRFRVRTVGHAAHSSAPEQGRNAISDMARAIVALEEEYIRSLDVRHPLTGRSTCSINVIRGGAEHNVVPERCEVTVDHRIVPGQSIDGALAAVRGVLGRLAERDDAFRYVLEEIEQAPPLEPACNGPLAEGVAELLQSSGIATAIMGAPYATDANRFGETGLPCVIVGPGDIAQAHTKDEWIATEQLEQGLAGYRRLMASTPPGA